MKNSFKRPKEPSSNLAETTSNNSYYKEESVNLNDWMKEENLRWTLHHTRQLRPSVNVWRGDSAPTPLIHELHDLDDLSVSGMDGQITSLVDILKQTDTDAFLVMHQGKVVYEKYFAGIQSYYPHGLASVTKSFVGILTAMQLHNGNIQLDDTVEKYIPELSGSAFADATIQQLLDMQVVCQYPQLFPQASYIDNQLQILLIAVGAQMAENNYIGPKTIYEFLSCTSKAVDHGTKFLYSNGPTETLGWILRRISGKTLAELLSEQIWSKLGSEEDAYFTIDKVFTEQASGGLYATLRDTARFAEMLRNDGFYNKQQIVPKEVISEIRKGGNLKLYTASESVKYKPRYSYHNQWWVNHGNKYGAFEAHGIFGQRIHIAPEAEMVIVQFSSYSDRQKYNDSFKLFDKAFSDIADHFN
ncbi:serine hydrolase domain-containing protein [Sporosarcina obsidiansis]|uniref:serine hydrolase domain-containing protein n=1 Tax=Sporosarcina obsidiansis TaxID=2660748 RepID=UPI00129AE0F1|nr:serine hydrolase [Sporosarcina obsidiansis]